MITFVREPSLSQLLRRLGLEKYSEVFHKNEIDMQLFLTMTDKELKEVKILLVFTIYMSNTTLHPNPPLKICGNIAKFSEICKNM